MPLPRRAARYGDQIHFVERVEPSTQQLEDADSARLVIRFQAGDQDAFATLYRRYFDRVYAYMRVAFRNSADAEDATQHVFVQAFTALERYEQRGRPFRAWLFTTVRNVALTELRKQGRVEVAEPEELDRQREFEDGDEAASLPDWISDRDLVLFVERLPLAQRQVLLLRFAFGFSGSEIASILSRSEEDVRQLQFRGLRFLKQRLSGVGRRPAARQRARIRGRKRQAQVLRGRRWALLSG